MRLQRLIVLTVALVRLAAAQTSSNCPASGIQPTGIVEGALAGADCSVLIWPEEETRANDYRLAVTQPGAYSLDLRAEPQFGTGAFTLTATFEVTNPANCLTRSLRWNEDVDGMMNFTVGRYLRKTHFRPPNEVAP